MHTRGILIYRNNDLYKKTFRLLENRKQNQLSLNQYQQQVGQKAMSADSILAMFRNFNTTMAMTEMSNYLSASTTPSCSSLQDEVVGSEDESLMSNAAHSPGKESPTRYRYSNVIQVSIVWGERRDAYVLIDHRETSLNVFSYRW